MKWTLHHWIATWVVLGLLVALADRLLWDILWVFILGIWLLYGGAALLLLGVATRLALQQPHRRGWAILGVGVILTASCLLVLGHPRLARLGDDWLFRYRFADAQPKLQAALAELQSSRTSATPREVQVDDGPPLRVAWRLPGGIIDNWEAIVYDPTGGVRSARGFTSEGRFTAPVDVVKLFGGDLVRCEPVTGPYYRCWFT